MNAAFGLREKLRVQAVDELCAYLASMLDDTSHADLPGLVGRTYDLRSAYKQFGTDPWHADRLRIAVKKPAGGYGVFSALALPFGAWIGGSFFEDFGQSDFHRRYRPAVGVDELF